LGFSDYLRDPINNTIQSFDEEEGFDYPDEDLGPDSDDDEETKKSALDQLDIDWLRYDTDNEPVYVYDFETDYPPPAKLVDPLDGMWTGQLLEVYDGETSVAEGTMSMMLTRAGDKLSGGVENFYDTLELEGTVTEERKVVFTITWEDYDYTAVCTGQYDPETDTIAGIWEEKVNEDGEEEEEEEEEEESDSEEEEEEGSESGSDSESDSGSESEEDEDANDEEEGSDDEKEGKEKVAVVGKNAEKDGEWVDEDSAEVVPEQNGDDSPTLTFIFRRTPAAAYRFRYTDAQFKENRARARWGFAIAATIDQVQRSHLSWPYLKKRFAERKRYIELAKRDKVVEDDLTPWTILNDDEEAEFDQLKNDLEPCDARFYDAAAVFELQKVVA
jgi:hypothetical protein